MTAVRTCSVERTRPRGSPAGVDAFVPRPCAAGRIPAPPRFVDGVASRPCAPGGIPAPPPCKGTDDVATAFVEGDGPGVAFVDADDAGAGRAEADYSAASFVGAE